MPSTIVRHRCLGRGEGGIVVMGVGRGRSVGGGSLCPLTKLLGWIGWSEGLGGGGGGGGWEGGIDQVARMDWRGGGRMGRGSH